MNVKRYFLLGLIFVLLMQNQVFAYEEKDTTEYTNGILTVVQGAISEEDQILEDYTKDIEINGQAYNVISVERVETDDNTKTVTIEKSDTLDTNNEDKIKSYFGESYEFDDGEFSGELPMSNIEITTVLQGSYEEIDEQRIEFSGYSQNDLNNIEKEITINNTIYYLINVDWQVENYEIIDNQEVPILYEGTMIYQTVVTKNNPNKYEVTVTYSGDVTKIDTIYEYSIFYQPEEVATEEIIEDVEEFNVVPVIIISGLGIGIIVLIILLKIENLKIYNKTDKGNKLIGKFKVNGANEIIDITKYQYKTSSNIYCLKLNKNLYSKLKDKNIYLQVGKIKKSIYINAQYIEIIV